MKMTIKQRLNGSWDVLVWHSVGARGGFWNPVATCSTKKEAKAYIK